MMIWSSTGPWVSMSRRLGSAGLLLTPRVVAVMVDSTAIGWYQRPRDAVGVVAGEMVVDGIIGSRRLPRRRKR